MEKRSLNVAWAGLGMLALVVGSKKAKTRLELSRAKHRPLTGHSRWARRVASLVPFYEFREDRFFRSDDAPDNIAARRRDGFAGWRNCTGRGSPKRAG